KKDGGFIGLIILIILGLAALKYFLNWDIFDAASTSEGQNTIGYIRNILNTVWSYIGSPLMWIWDEVAWPILSLAWESVQTLIRK
ncbi:MAG: hypothetical protein AAB780_00530, partial [Patescibacteria group bacterium]